MDEQIVVFKLGTQFYAVPVSETKEIIRMVPITPVPKQSCYTEGIINLRGRVTPVLNLSRRLGLTEKEYDRDTRIIVMETGEKSVGMIVDAVVEVGTYNDEEIEPPAQDGADFLKGVVKREDRLWMLLDLKKLL